MELILPLVFYVLTTVSECHQYMGCYQDLTGGIRLMDHKSDFKGSLTPELCIDHCKSKKFSYAGAQFAYECFCSNNRPSFKEAAHPQDCNYKCEGDESKMCGGWNRLSVYDLKDLITNFVESNYMGCYADTGEDKRALKDKDYYESDHMTPEFCAGYCYSYGYRYSGVQAGKQCFCGDEINGDKANENDCSQKCAGSSLFNCGGSFRSNIYHTSISDESEKGRLLGCYKDSDDRLLTGFVVDLPETNNPRKCLNICLQLGFKYCGVQVGIQCFCGNKRPDPNRKAPDKECQKECPKGGEKICGEVWRMNIYSTSPLVHGCSESQRFMGCYKDFNHGSRLMPHKTDFKGTLTPELCINHCKSKGFIYAGTQFSHECFCSSERLLYTDIASPEECNNKCDGDKTKMCGGSNRLSVYELEDNRINFVQTNYVGCYADFGENNRALMNKFHQVEAMTPEYCVGYCFSFGYRFSGVQSGKQCYCGDEIKGKKVNEGECNHECSGNSRFICGGTWRNSIYHTAISDESEEGQYLGCYEDSNDRLLTGFVIALKETNNPRRCLNICLKHGFMYAGVQVGFECFCGNKKPDTKRLAPEEDCQAPCPKGRAKVCGGVWRMNIYSTSSITPTRYPAETLFYMGCYKENVGLSRLMYGDQKDFKGSLTPEICINYCKSKGFIYAGAQFGFECFCSNERPSFKYISDPADCNSKCEGDQSKICGGYNRISVYDLKNHEINFVQSGYVGCYADDGGIRRALRDKSHLEYDHMTPEFCVGYCYSYGYRFSGVQAGKQCFCGDEIKGDKTNEGDCNFKCAGNSRFNCGGAWRSNVYHTFISDESEEGRFLGCFEDSNDRLLTGYLISLPETNSPRRCLNICLQLGFMFAGVQHRNECFCGDKTPDPKRMAPENNCQAPCPKDGLRACGGVRRMNIYSTAPPKDNIIGPGLHVINSGAVGYPLTSYNQKPPTQETISPTKPCTPSKTEQEGKTVCQGEVIFHEKFDNWIPRVWKHEVFMPEGPDYEFVIFDKTKENSFLLNGKLHIKPTIFDDEFVRSGSLFLDSCTGRRYSKECERKGKTYILLPPVRSARITTKESFSFKYGKVTVRAKLPVGDWLVPEIWLEPKERVYGPEYQSGRIKIAHSFGNLYLSHQGRDIGSRQLQSGIAMGPESRIRERDLIRQHKSNKGWHDEYHNYTLIWTPYSISFQIDNEPVEDLIPANSGKLSHLLGFHTNIARIWDHGSELAPFDQEFYVSIGVSVGGMREFPDNAVTSRGHYKPWNNYAVKSLVEFWNDRINWYPTWNDNNHVLIIEDIIVYAL